MKAEEGDSVEAKNTTVSSRGGGSEGRWDNGWQNTAR